MKIRMLCIYVCAVMVGTSCMLTKPTLSGQTVSHRFDSIEFSPDERYALVLGGGGARGAYEIGVFRAMKELNHPIHIVTGTSVGALNSIFVVMDDLKTAESMWRTVDKTMIFSNPDYAPTADEGKDGSRDIRMLLQNFAAGTQDDYEPLKQLMNSHYNSERFYSSPIDFGTVVFDTKKLAEKTIVKKDIAPEKLPEYMLASAACYPAFTPYEVDGSVFIDGGYADNVPADLAKQLGATKFVVVDLNAPGIIAATSRAIINQPDTVVVSPYWDLGSILYFDPINSERNMRLGYLDALKSFSAFNGRAFTFFEGSFDCLDDYNARFESLAALPPCKAVFRRHWAEKFTTDKIMITGAEFAAEIFNLNPLYLYREDFFNAQLREKIRSVHARERTLRSYDRLKIVLDDVKLLRKLEYAAEGKPRTIPPAIRTSAALHPREFFAAVYIYLENLDGNGPTLVEHK